MSFDPAVDNMEPIEWDQFLIDADLSGQGQALVASPLPTGADTPSPKSTESEQSQALDPSDPSPELDFTLFDLPGGTMNRREDMYDALPTYQPDQRGTRDPTMTSTFGMNFCDFGSMTGLGEDAASQLGLTHLFDKLSSPIDPAPSTDIDLQAAYAALGWVAPSAIEPSQLVSPRPSLKRKDSDSSAETSVAKRPRGRPPKGRVDAKRPYRRQSKSGSSVTALVAAAITDTPVSRSVTFAEEDDSYVEFDASIGKTKSGKASTARPKSVVPEKFLKDGSAQTILGMTVDQIQSFPTFEELLKVVSPSLRAGATEFGERIKENRDKAKDAAKKSRDERRAKIDSLEKTVSDLEGTIAGMKGVLVALVGKGLLSQAEVTAWV